MRVPGTTAEAGEARETVARPAGAPPVRPAGGMRVGLGGVARVVELAEGTVKLSLFLALKGLAESLRCLAPDSTTD